MSARFSAMVWPYYGTRRQTMRWTVIIYLDLQKPWMPVKRRYSRSGRVIFWTSTKRIWYIWFYGQYFAFHKQNNEHNVKNYGHHPKTPY